jgi:2-keto-4-pentenoate hydratase
MSMSTSHIQNIAERLIAARAGRRALTPTDCSALPITTRAESYAVQAEVWRRQQGEGRPKAWKIGNSSDDPTPVRAAMPRVVENGKGIQAGGLRLFGIEAEIAVRFARDLPPRAEVWSRELVLAAIGSAHIAIEVVDTALLDYVAAGPFLRLADSMLHGSFALGEALTDWRNLSWQHLTMQSFIDDMHCAEATGGHPHVDPLALLPWWVNEGAKEWGGVQAGDIVTTGTWNGMHFGATPQLFKARLVNAAGETLGCASVEFTK